MTVLNYDAMSLDELRRYMLTHREDIEAFHVYVDRSQEEGRMQSIDAGDSNWQEKLDKKVYERLSPSHHPQEQNYWNETVEIETEEGQKFSMKTYLIRVYPEPVNSYDAYVEMSFSGSLEITRKISRIYSPRLGKTWDVIGDPIESPIGNFIDDNMCLNGNTFLGEDTNWMLGLKVAPEQTA